MSKTEDKPHPLTALACRLYSRGYMDAFKDCGYDPWDTCTDAETPAIEELNAYEGDGIREIETRAVSAKDAEISQWRKDRDGLWQKIEVQDAENARLRAMLEGIEQFGRNNPGKGFTCGRMAAKALEPQQAKEAVR